MELKKVVCENGVCRWRCETDEVYRQFEYTRAVRTGAFINGFMLLFGFLVLRGEYLLLMVLTCGIISLIVMACSRYILNRPGNETIPFELREDYIRTREGRGSVIVSFSSVRYIETQRNRVDLFTRFSRIPIYIPEEDFDQISRLIADRVRDRRPQYPA